MLWVGCVLTGTVLLAREQSLQDRFNTLETFRLPDMDGRIERASTAQISQACRLCSDTFCAAAGTV